MLGLTFNCAKCHDHKYDPLSQVAYYQFRAIFEPYQIRTDMLPGQTDFEVDGIPRAFDAHLDVPTWLHVRGDDRQPDKNRTLEPGVPAFLSSDALKLGIEPVSLPIEATYPGLRPFVLTALREAGEQQIIKARAAVDAAKKKFAEAEAAAKELAATTTTPGSSGGSPEITSIKDTGQPASQPVDQARLTVTIAENALKTAAARLASIGARAVADQARFKTPAAGSQSGAKELALAASRTERLVAVSLAEEELSRAEVALLQAAAENTADAENKLSAAKTALRKTLEEIDTPSEDYTMLPGAKKTQEDYQNRNADEPRPATSTGRRSALANWLTDPRHPLPARVAVNHIWARHMGQPLVPTVFDFGRNGTPPTHLELLDWLAVELVEHHWSMKHIHRLIVTSQVYRLSSSSRGATDATLAADPDNRFYWRMNPVRMEAQIVRDSLLSLAGELDGSLGGPSIAVDDEKSRRRSLYFVHSHNDHHKFLSMFDDANVLDCYRRTESIVPQQALALENSPFVTEMADRMMHRITAACPDASDSRFIHRAFLTILSVEPTPDERSTLTELLQRMNELAGLKNRPNPRDTARTSVIQIMLNHNDFITIR